MTKLRISQKGVILFMVLVSVLMTVILAGIILNIITSNARFSQHQVSRVQAYYAAMAGVNYAIEKLSSQCCETDTLPCPTPLVTCWTKSVAFTKYICRSTTTPQVCNASACNPICSDTRCDSCNPIDDSLPAIIQQVKIDVSGSPRRIDATATYTYTP